MTIGHGNGADHFYVQKGVVLEHGHQYVTKAVLGLRREADLDAATSPWGATVSRAQGLLRGSFPELYRPLPNEQSPRSHALRQILRANGHADADNAFVMTHPHPEWRRSSVVSAPDQFGDYHPGVALHPDRNDYGTLAHEAGHLLHHDAAGIDAHGEHGDELKHGPDFLHHYQRALHAVHPEAAQFLGEVWPRIHNTIERSNARQGTKERKYEKPQKCHWCKQPATKSMLWAEHMAYVPTCDTHEQKTRDHLEGQGDEVEAVRPIKQAAHVAARQTWYHGTHAEFERFDQPQHSQHWNNLVGPHFAADEGLAGGFGHGGRVLHTQLDMTNPKHYESEHDMDRDAYGHEFEAGNHPPGREQDGDLREQDRDNPWRFMGWLHGHPDKPGIAHRFRERLKAAGHDGIVYGNALEGSDGSDRRCAIAFHPDQVKIIQSHPYDENASEPGHPDYDPKNPHQCRVVTETSRQSQATRLTPEEFARERPHGAAVAQAQDAARWKAPTMGMDLGKPEDATSAVQYMMRRGGHPDADETFVMKHPNPGWEQSQAFFSDGQPGISLHPDRWDYGTAAHEVAHHLHEHELGHHPRSDAEAHGPEFIRHYQNVLGGFGPDAARVLGETYHQSLNRLKTSALQRRTAAIRMVPPEEYQNFRYPDYPQAKNPAALVRHFKKTSPEYYDKVKRDVQANGFTTPVLVRWKDPRGKPMRKPEVMEGHHRAAVAHELGMHLPVGDYEDQSDYDTAFRAGQSWWQDNHRPTDDMPKVTGSAEVPFTFSHEETQTGGMKHPKQVDLHAHHPDSDEPVGTLRYFPPKRRGGVVDVDELKTHHPGAGSALLNEMESRHPGSRTNFLWEVKRNNNNPSVTGHGEKGAGDPSDWDTHYPNLASQVHRGLALTLPPQSARVVNSSAPKEEHLAELHAGLSGAATGTHWTENERSAQQFAHNAVSDYRTTIPVVVHAQTPQLKDIETRREHLYRGGVFPYGNSHSKENEVPVRNGRSLTATGISWRPDAPHPDADENGWVHHTYDEPMQRKAVTDKWPPYLTERPDEYGDMVPVNVSRKNPRGPVGTEEEAQQKGWAGPYYHGTSKRRARDIRQNGFRQPRIHNWEMADYGTQEEVDHGNTHRTFFADSHKDAHDFARAQHGDDADVVTAYLHPHHLTTEEGGGFMDSTQVKDVAHAMAIRPSRRTGKQFTPFADQLTLRDSDVSSTLPGARKLEAHHPEHGKVGEMYWQHDPYVISMGRDRPTKEVYPRGMVRQVMVDPEHQRKGVATMMWNRAKEITPWLSHSDNQSDDGRAWAQTVATFTPTKRLFGPTQGLDHRLFDGEHLKGDVREYIISTLSRFWEPMFGECGWEEWAIVYFAGSEASEWTSPTLEGNNDFDVLIGVDYQKFRGCQSRTSKYQAMSDEEITADINRGLRVLDEQTAYVWIPIRTDVVGSETWHHHSSSHLTKSTNSSPSTTQAVRQRPSRESSASTSVRSAATSNLPESHETCSDALHARSVSSVECAMQLPYKPFTGPAVTANHSTSVTDISESTSGSQRQSSTRSSQSRAEDAVFVGDETFCSPSITTTAAAQANVRAGNVYGESSVRAAIRRSATSVKPIFTPQSYGWTADSPPSAPDGWAYVGPFNGTFYVNQDSYDIRAIKPYAAYDVTHDRWAVKPPHLENWTLEDFPEGHALVLEARAVAAYVRAILKLPEPYRTQQGFALWNHLHSDRSRAFGPQGEGWYDPGNVLEKWLDQAGLWEKLVEIMVRARRQPETLNAPVDWGNDPRNRT